jgi:ElaB/YqjD/DUF883 family membrane-anchored ribosome-binding protein
MNPSNVSPPTNSPDVGGAGPSPSAPTGASAGPLTSAASTGEQLKQSASAAAAQIKEKVSSTASQLKQNATGMVEQRKQQVADQIRGYSSKIRESGKPFENEDPNIAWVAQQASDRLQRVADYVREADFHQLRTDAESFARRHPAVVLGGMFVTGLLLGSILRAGSSSRKETSDSTQDYDYDPETRPGEAFTSSSPVVPESSEI